MSTSTTPIHPLLSAAFATLFALAALALAAPSLAQTAGEVEIDRPSDDLLSSLRDPVDPADPTAVDSALVFTSTGVRTAVRCLATDYEGQQVGAAFTWVPPQGLRVIRASDFGPGDFVGSVHCRSIGAVVGSAFLLGPKGATDLPSHQRRRRITPRKARRAVYHTEIDFPVVASY